MPLNEIDKAWIRQEIQASHKRKGFGKLAGFIKDWSGTGGLIAILLFTLTQWTAYIEFRTDTKSRLTGIEKTLTQLALQNQASLPLSSFEKTLPDLKSVVESARKQNVKVSPNVLGGLQFNLINSDKNSPVYWPTVAQFIDYRSFDVSSWEARANLPNCTKSLPKPMVISSVESPTKATISRAVYEGCVFTLDSAEDNRMLNYELQNGYPLILFKHCLIVYRGGRSKFDSCLEERINAHEHSRRH